jgi:hypothetical protein
MTHTRFPVALTGKRVGKLPLQANSEGRTMKLPKNLWRAALLGSTMIACQAKQTPAPVKDAPAQAAVVDSASMDLLRGRIDSLIGDAACTSASQCRLIGVGAKACGGPKGYRVYSVGRTDSVALAAVVDQYNTREKEFNRKEGRLSDCSMAAKPEIRVENGRCVIAQ